MTDLVANPAPGTPGRRPIDAVQGRAPIAALADIASAVPGIPRDIGAALPGGELRDRYPMLGHVDPYGDTCFNHLQVTTLLDELNHLTVSEPTDDRVALLDALRVLVAEHMSRPHRYLWFIGD